ncbi:MAG: hypothetical protein JNN05_04450, partial [Candidatus Omnitrophica bacterium]|nr:hypothetical protein [Candidatus Omnitrophota bacterium]
MRTLFGERYIQALTMLGPTAFDKANWPVIERAVALAVPIKNLADILHYTHAGRFYFRDFPFDFQDIVLSSNKNGYGITRLEIPALFSLMVRVRKQQGNDFESDVHQQIFAALSDTSLDQAAQTLVQNNDTVSNEKLLEAVITDRNKSMKWKGLYQAAWLWKFDNERFRVYEAGEVMPGLQFVIHRERSNRKEVLGLWITDRAITSKIQGIGQFMRNDGLLIGSIEAEAFSGQKREILNLQRYLHPNKYLPADMNTGLAQLEALLEKMYRRFAFSDGAKVITAAAGHALFTVPVIAMHRNTIERINQIYWMAGYEPVITESQDVLWQMNPNGRNFTEKASSSVMRALIREIKKLTRKGEDDSIMRLADVLREVRDMKEIDAAETRNALHAVLVKLFTHKNHDVRFVTLQLYIRLSDVDIVILNRLQRNDPDWAVRQLAAQTLTGWEDLNLSSSFDQPSGSSPVKSNKEPNLMIVRKKLIMNVGNRVVFPVLSNNTVDLISGPEHIIVRIIDGNFVFESALRSLWKWSGAQPELFDFEVAIRLHLNDRGTPLMTVDKLSGEEELMVKFSAAINRPVERHKPDLQWLSAFHDYRLEYLSDEEMHSLITHSIHQYRHVRVQLALVIGNQARTLAQAMTAGEILGLIGLNQVVGLKVHQQEEAYSQFVWTQALEPDMSSSPINERYKVRSPSKTNGSSPIDEVSEIAYWNSLKGKVLVRIQRDLVGTVTGVVTIRRTLEQNYKQRLQGKAQEVKVVRVVIAHSSGWEPDVRYIDLQHARDLITVIPSPMPSSSPVTKRIEKLRMLFKRLNKSGFSAEQLSRLSGKMTHSGHDVVYLDRSYILRIISDSRLGMRAGHEK